MNVKSIREQFPALERMYHGRKAVYMDGPGGSQVVRQAIDAMCSYMQNGGANLHGAFPTSWETEKIIADARQAIADLVGSEADEVAFGANMTSLSFAIARALGRTWTSDDELVVTELDHRANVDTWKAVAEDLGMTVRWIPVNQQTLSLDTTDIHKLINEKTKLVAVGLASNAVGTINDVAAISARAHEVGALVAVDAVHAAPHIFVDRDELGADILLCSGYKFFGPHVGAAVIRKELFDRLVPYKIHPAPDYLPDKLETGTQNHEGLAGLTAAIDFIASLGEGPTRRQQIRSAFEQIEAYEESLVAKMRHGLASIPGIRLFQATSDVRKTPTVAFQVEGVAAPEVCRYLAEEYSVFIADGHFYAETLADKLGVNEQGGFVRAGLAPYNTSEEIDVFLEGVHAFVSQASNNR